MGATSGHGLTGSVDSICFPIGYAYRLFKQPYGNARNEARRLLELTTKRHGNQSKVSGKTETWFDPLNDWRGSLTESVLGIHQHRIDVDMTHIILASGYHPFMTLSQALSRFSSIPHVYSGYPTSARYILFFAVADGG
jgi:hypothetical protein